MTCIVVVAAGSCGRERPCLPDGANSLQLWAVDTSNVDGLGWVPVGDAAVRVSSPSFIFSGEYRTGPDGWTLLEDLPAGTYRISIEKINQEENYVILGHKELSLVYEPSAVDTVLMNYQQSSPLTINEIYYAGCNYSQFYYFDQFVELYNSSADTIWLDGHIVCRSQQTTGVIDLEAVDYALAYYVYAFPGQTGVTRTCPIAPGEFLVIATDAIDHSRYGARCVDLSSADWEFFAAHGNDYDNPEVPNLLPVTTTGVDFSMNLVHGAIFIATGEEWEFATHWHEGNELNYVHIPLRTIIDGVEYSSNPDAERYMTLRIDAGFAGVGNARYSAQSVQRRFPGLDSNNSAFDFVITDRATPGYH